MKQRILVVDDSPFIRRLITDWLRALPEEFEIVGTAQDGDEAVSLAMSLKPDVITLDIEMPKRDGLSALQQIMKEVPTKVVMVSSLTSTGAEHTLKALELGAIDFVTKPGGSTSLKFTSSQSEIIGKLRAAASAKVGKPTRPAPKSVNWAPTDKVLVIGTSTGGPNALCALWKGLPANLTAPILIVQHMPEGFTASLARRLDGLGTVPCKEAVDGDRIVPGQALLAPGGKHMVVDGGVVRITTDPPMHGTRPAVDKLFDSAAKQFGSKVVGAILTGMGKDGAAGAMMIKEKGGIVLTESEETCVIYGMPKVAKETGATSGEYPIFEMAQALVACLTKHARAA